VAHAVAVVFVMQVDAVDAGHAKAEPMTPAGAQALAASVAMVTLYPDAVPGIPSGSVQSV
jgi:hypothetical protein